VVRKRTCAPAAAAPASIDLRVMVAFIEGLL
jgi:hypothetical protein